MTYSSETDSILNTINNNSTKLGDLRKIANELKKNHKIANELWSSNSFHARLLAILIMDKKLLSNDVIDELINDISLHIYSERMQLIDWLFANQLTKDKKLIEQIESWDNNNCSLKRRVYWYYQARLRWMGKIQSNSESLLLAIEKNIESEKMEVQWAMNYTAGWIGVYELQLRDRCIHIGEKTGLFKDNLVSKGCTPNYLPEFIAIESRKRGL